MKTNRNRFLKPAFVTTLALALSLSAVAQTHEMKPVTLKSDAHSSASAASAQASDAQKSFDALKTLAGGWKAVVTTDPPMPDMGEGTTADVSLRVTSRGNAIVHEMKGAGTPDDPARYDHPVTMLYLDGDRLHSHPLLRCRKSSSHGCSDFG